MGRPHHTYFLLPARTPIAIGARIKRAAAGFLFDHCAVVTRPERLHSGAPPMTPSIDVLAVAQALRRDVDRTKRGSKRMKLVTLLKKFGCFKLSGAAATRISNALDDADIVIDPLLLVRSGTEWTVGLEDWVYLTARDSPVERESAVSPPPVPQRPKRSDKVTILEGKIRAELRELKRRTGFEFSSEHIIDHVRWHHGITLSWEQALRFTSDGYDRISLQSILNERRDANRAAILKYGLISAAAFVCFILYQTQPGRPQQDHVEESPIAVETYTPAEPKAVPPVPAYSQPTTQGSRTMPFNSKSNGNTWRSASESDKRALCERLQLVSTKGNSANFYYDLLDSTYSTTDSYTLRQPINDVIRLGEAASSFLPLEQRNY